MEEIKKSIMRYVEGNSQGIASHTLLRKLNPQDTALFYRALNQLRKEGKVFITRDQRVRLEKKKKATVKAKIISLSRGFAFARTLESGDDVFIHANRLNNAFLGDTVLLSHMQQGEKGFSADVDSIEEQSEHTVTGTLVREKDFCELIPDDAIRYHVPVENAAEAGAKNADKVKAELRRIPGTSGYAADVVKIYGDSRSARICSDAIIDRNGIRTRFPDEVIAEAKRISGQPITEKDLEGRLDLRGEAICTIDSADAKDLDDSISVSRTENGYRLGVHIADVSHYVRAGSAIDAEALERGTSVYFADRVVPMLPEELSNGVCSLNAGEDKLTFSALVDLDRQGEIRSYRFAKSVIRSKARGVYSEVNQLLEGSAGESIRRKYAPVLETLRAAKELADILKARSVRNGTVEIESSEPKFTLDENGVCINVEPRRPGTSEQMIEQLMITANQAAARLAKEHDLPFVYRVHEQPDPERVETLIQIVGALGLNPRSLKHDGRIVTGDFAEIMQQAVGTPAQKLISHQLLRTMAKARYDIRPIGHFGLALADYCHFTSPIRRYPDTAIHRILSAFLATKDRQAVTSRFLAFVSTAASRSSEAEIRAMQAERSAEDCYMAEYMTQHIGEQYVGVISGVTQRGVFVELENSVEGFVPIDSFEGAEYQFDGMISQVDRRTKKKLTIGQPLAIRVVGADVASGRIDFIPDAQAE